MYVLVRLLKGFSRPLFYKVPENCSTELIGKVVQVPLKKNTIPALVLKKYENLPKDINFEIKEFLSIQKFPDDSKYNGFIEKVSKFYFIEPLHFYQRIRNFLFKKENKEQGVDKSDAKESKKVELTDEQTHIVKFVEKFIDKPSYCPTLIHGVTGSGKTEVYKKLIEQCLENNKTVIFLVPEVSLSVQFQALFQKELASKFSIIGFHSASKVSEKNELWRKLTDSKPVLIVGVHLPIVLPISNLGLIIVDEEHESGFQEKKHPRINSKEVAIWRAKEYDIPIVLGSATPSLNSFFNTENKKWNFFQLKKRFSGNFPDVELVYLKDKKAKRRKSFWISQTLQDAITQTLEKKEQVIIYINRRGYCFFVQCKKCGFIFQCPNCSVSLTFHSRDNKDFLSCHYCDYKKDLGDECSSCGAKDKDLIKKGIGTQQVVKILENIFPEAKVKRADLDSASKKRSWQETVIDFEKGAFDILVGTKLITKGYHFPKVTLVGILWADLNLHFPVFNASETTLQQLIQVAGRAGRASDKSRVIVQAMHENPIFEYLNEVDYLEFCKQELEFRKLASYPPFGRFVQIELQNVDPNVLDKDSKVLFDVLSDINISTKLNILVLGPSKPIVYRIQKTESRHIYIKSDDFYKVHLLLNKINFSFFNSRIFVVPTT